jgi:PTS system fructose-specific IIC component/PTS system nitrogen regulatory IIA component
MLLSEVFLPEFIRTDLEASGKNDLFEEMVDHFCHVTNLGIKSDILTALKNRESQMSTGIQNGIAIPHGKTMAVDKVYGVLGVSKKGIDYDSLDGKPVHLILMILAPPVEAEAHLSLLQRMANMLRNPDFYRDIIACGTPDAVFDVIRKYESIDILP